ncbi:MAG: YrdC/Sua5 family protein, required for threonylcarbamoyladenosine ((6)A) formation in tRNA [Bacteroidetes bacterium]|nr:YrdC/Sua5 family protein, required for threonylcarbamoyladenosine ((6)A) formation in tRNA [Bacteroidota bacterium]
MALTMEVSLTRPEDKPLVLAAEVIQAGGIIVYPTETLYGIGANAWDGSAIAKVRALKHRTDQKPILVIAGSQDQLRSLTDEISPLARRFIDAFWPGPLTLVFTASKSVPDILSRGTGTIGVRIPSSPVCLRLLELAGCPLTSSSANLSGKPPLYNVAEIRRAIPKGVDLFLDGGQLPPSRPSTVLDVTGGVSRLLREGTISEERLRAVDPHLVVEQPLASP